jgi:hypothetical protein
MQHILATTAFAGCRPPVQEGTRCQRSTQSPLRPCCSDCRSLLRLQTVRPSLTLPPTCDAAARFSIMAGRDKEACLEDEHTAESTLAQNWSKYNAVDKTQCIGNVKTGGPASYVELLSCLEIMRDAKDIGEGAPLIRSDQPVQSTPRRRR